MPSPCFAPGGWLLILGGLKSRLPSPCRALLSCPLAVKPGRGSTEMPGAAALPPWVVRVLPARMVPTWPAGLRQRAATWPGGSRGCELSGTLPPRPGWPCFPSPTRTARVSQPEVAGTRSTCTAAGPGTCWGWAASAPTPGFPDPVGRLLGSLTQGHAHIRKDGAAVPQGVSYFLMRPSNILRGQQLPVGLEPCGTPVPEEGSEVQGDVLQEPTGRLRGKGS